jgi:hypothetical protein
MELRLPDERILRSTNKVLVTGVGRYLGKVK